MRVVLAIAAIAVLLSTTASAQGLGVHVLGGIVIADEKPDGRVDNPGFCAGAGLDLGFSQNFVLRGTAVYSHFPLFTADPDDDAAEPVTDGSQTNVDVEFVLRLSPKGTTPPGAPVLYFLIGTGAGLMTLDPGLASGDDQVEYTFGQVGIGFESKIGSNRMRLWVEVVARATSAAAGSYYPIRVGFRF